MINKPPLDFSDNKILVIGDVMLDEYWEGDATRISPEAPVPVVLVENVYSRAGGAANVALNVNSLGCCVDLMGIIGDDEFGQTLQKLLKQTTNINNLLLISRDYTTINKLRILSNNQQLFRIDKEKICDLSLFKKLVDKFHQTIENNHDYKAIVLSDYNKGVLQDPQIFINKANKYNIPIIIDPKNYNFKLFKNASILTPNLKEFQQMIGLSKEEEINFNSPNYKTNHNSYQQIILEKGHNLIKELNLKALIITQGKNGLTLLTNDYQDQHFYANRREVFDVTGAGDTVTAIISACIANNYTLHQAAYLANIGAGLVVNKLGTSCVSMAEIIQESTRLEQAQIFNYTENNNININDKTAETNNINFQQIINHNKNLIKFGVISEDQLFIIIKHLKLLGETIVLVNGCFDVLHAGHIHYLEKAKSFGNRLIVAVNSDESIKKLKGNHRPINSLHERMQVLASLKAVDWVVPFGSKQEIYPGRIIAKLNPSILIKSKEYYKTVEEIPEHEGAAHVINNGGVVYLLDRPLIENCDFSSTKIINTINKNKTLVQD